MALQRPWTALAGGALAVALSVGAHAGDQEYDPVAAYESVGGDRAMDLAEEACFQCHGPRAAFMGAPRKGDHDAWDFRLEARGFDGMIENTIRGFGAMPPRGGADLSDEEIAAAIVAMMLESDFELEEIE